VVELPAPVAVSVYPVVIGTGLDEPSDRLGLARGAASSSQRGLSEAEAAMVRRVELTGALETLARPLAVPGDHLAIVESAAVVIAPVAVAEVTGLGKEGRGFRFVSRRATALIVVVGEQAALITLSSVASALVQGHRLLIPGVALWRPMMVLASAITAAAIAQGAGLLEQLDPARCRRLWRLPRELGHVVRMHLGKLVAATPMVLPAGAQK
jgi:hypothetical protein